MRSEIIEEIQRQIDRNKQFSIGILVAALLNAALVAYIVGAIAGGQAGLITFGVILLWVGIAYVVLENFVLGSTGARDPSGAEERRIMPMLERLSGTMGLATPRLKIVDDDAPNAFAIGSVPPKASVTYSTGLLARLNDEELEGVTAHELSHIANGDSRISALSLGFLGWALVISALGAVIAIGIGLWGLGMLTGNKGEDWAGVLAGICVGIVMICLAVMVWLALQAWSVIAQIAHLSFSRQREWLADSTAVTVTSRPLALASALEKIAATDASLARGGYLARSFCLAGPPLKGNWWADLFDTHPNVWARIERLRSYTGGG